MYEHTHTSKARTASGARHYCTYSGAVVRNGFVCGKSGLYCVMLDGIWVCWRLLVARERFVLPSKSVYVLTQCCGTAALVVRAKCVQARRRLIVVRALLRLRVLADRGVSTGGHISSRFRHHTTRQSTRSLLCVFLVEFFATIITSQPHTADCKTSKKPLYPRTENINAEHAWYTIHT